MAIGKTPRLLQRILGVQPWSKAWQDHLGKILAENQRGLPVSMVVVVARESDTYSELLFLLSFCGLALGTIASLALSAVFSTQDLLLLPFIGFSIGATAHAFRRFFLKTLAKKAMRERVSQKAKSLFYDHFSKAKRQLVVLYISEVENEALLVMSPDLAEYLKPETIEPILSKLVAGYLIRDPMVSLEPSIRDLCAVIKTQIHMDALAGAQLAHDPVFLGATDLPQVALGVPILKGSKDIN